MSDDTLITIPRLLASIPGSAARVNPRDGKDMKRIMSRWRLMSPLANGPYIPKPALLIRSRSSVDAIARSTTAIPASVARSARHYADPHAIDVRQIQKPGNRVDPCGERPG